MGKKKTEIEEYLIKFINDNFNKDKIEIHQNTLLVDILISPLEFGYSLAEVSVEIESDLGKNVPEDIYLNPDEGMTFGGFVDFIFGLDDLLKKAKAKVKAKAKAKT